MHFSGFTKPNSADNLDLHKFFNDQLSRFGFLQKLSTVAEPTISSAEEFSQDVLASVNAQTKEIGKTIFSQLSRSNPWFFQRRWWDDRIMDWSMKDEQLKVQLFRFVDVLPMLNTNDLVVQHLKQYLGQAPHALPWFLKFGLNLFSKTSPTRAIVAKVVKMGASNFAKKFMAGANAKEVIASTRSARKLGRGFTLDILGEAVASQAEADGYFEAYKTLIRQVAPEVNTWEDNSIIDFDANGRIPRTNLSVKLSALDPHFDPIDFDGVTERVGQRLRDLLRVAKEQKAFINVDMESYEKKDLTLHIFKKILSESEFRDRSDVGIVIQCYLKESGHDFVQLRDWAKKRGTPVWVRLVKGAYWDYETAHAQAEGWPIPVYEEKWQSDANYEAQIRFVMQNHEYLRPAFGSHNLRSISHGLAVAEELKMPPGSFEVQMLYGMADPEQKAIVDRGHRLRVYMPYGQLIPGMAYLVRRLLENTANDSFLRVGSSSNVDVDQIMSTPERETAAAISVAVANESNHYSSSDSKQNDETSPKQESPKTMKATFKNEPPVDFALEEKRSAMANALVKVRNDFGRTFPLVIGGDKITTPDSIESVNPSKSSEVVGKVSVATATHIDQAVAAAKNAFKTWSRTTAVERADFLHKAADEMRTRFFELSAVIVYECGKPWREATNDVCEAIDFLDFYADKAIEMDQVSGADVPGEENRFEYLPRGIVGVIAPWNFPLAILTGMAAAGIATGNTVLLKPAEQSSVIAAKLMEIFETICLPAGVANFVPGYGESAGARLVEHPDVSLIVFTGSRQVGLAINAKAAEVSAHGAPMVKKVIAEMGGKNSIIVDIDADLDEAVLGTVYSAFGFQGQKCSACSRVIVLENVYDLFVERLAESVKSLIVGPADEPGTIVGPVVDEEAQKKILSYIELGKTEGREVVSLDVSEHAANGYFVPPSVFADISPNAKIAQEEIFGPVLAVIKVKDLDEAIEVANNTEYGLTGGIFSRSPEVLDRVRRELMVGNIYLNRSITGAVVARQPFGGFKMSGIGSKAGGHDYLLQFVLPRTITENTMRRGFVPPEE